MRNNFYISFGIWIAILPFIGVPNMWKTILITLSGVFIFALNVTPLILKKLEQPKSSRPRKKQSSSPAAATAEAPTPLIKKTPITEEVKELRFSVESREPAMHESR